jgi:hypothetical protein
MEEIIIGICRFDKDKGKGIIKVTKRDTKRTYKVSMFTDMTKANKISKDRWGLNMIWSTE